MKTIYTKLLFFLLLLPAGILAQNTISGTVLEKSSGQPLPGVSVVVQGTTNGTSTDFDGNYTLSNVKKGDVITFSYLGFTDSSITYDSQSTMNISLDEDAASELDEVVVQVGYGSVRKKDATGSLSTVTEKDFNRGSVVTSADLLNGRVAGLTINTSGAPGSGSTIRIRGGGSLSAINDPLIVVDGLPIDNNTVAGSTSFLASLNPSVIESMTVLKDASATAIYGSRASNGVIIIVTKKGGKALSVDYNFQYGSGKTVKTIDVFNADQFRALVTELRPGDVDELGTANTNWQDAIYRRTDFVDNNISVRGNLFNMIPARLTLGNTYQEGLRLTNAFNRTTVGVALNPSLFKDHLKIRVNANYAKEKNRFADAVELSALTFDPTQPIYDANSPYGGYFQYYDATQPGNPLDNASRNPVAQLLQTNDNGSVKRFFGNVEMDYKFHFFPALRAVVNVGFDEARGRRARVVGANAASAPSNADIPYGADELTEQVKRNRLLDAYLNYNKTINSFNMDITAGYSYQSFQSEQYVMGNQRDPNLPPNFPETTRDTDVVLIGLFGRANFTYNDKYLLTLSLRRDGSSRFSEDNRWGNFPAAAFAWKLKEEFFKSTTVLSDLKLRLGYGVTGQQNFDAANEYLQKYITGDGVSQYVIGNSPVPIGQLAGSNPAIKWEEAITYNVGLDYGFANNRITGAIDVFYRDTQDLIFNGPVADGSNTSNFAWQNIGSFTTKGIEFSVNADVVKSTNFNWNANFNASTYERRITSLINGADVRTGENIGGTGTFPTVHSVDFTPHSFWVYKQLYNSDGQPIEGAYADINGDGIRNEEDKYIYKNSDPDVTFGFASNMTYRNIDFSFNMRASIGNHALNGVNANGAQLDLIRGIEDLHNLPIAVQETNFNTVDDVILSDIYVENASFLRMDNITLGYTFPKWIDGKASLRLSAGVQNAFVLTEYSGLDPEITNNGLDRTIYPRQRTVLFGVNVKF